MNLNNEVGTNGSMMLVSVYQLLCMSLLNMQDVFFILIFFSLFHIYIISLEIINSNAQKKIYSL